VSAHARRGGTAARRPSRPIRTRTVATSDLEPGDRVIVGPRAVEVERVDEVRTGGYLVQLAVGPPIVCPARAAWQVAEVRS
jgi:hypothetical protein